MPAQGPLVAVATRRLPSGDTATDVKPAEPRIIADFAFYGCGGLTNVTLPWSVTRVGYNTFANCTGLANVTIANGTIGLSVYAFQNDSNLLGVYFLGNAPSVGSGVFTGDTNTVVYYLPGTTGWTSSLGGLPTALWNPQVQTADGQFGVGTTGFGFTIAGTKNIPVVIEASSDLASSAWDSLQTCTLTNGSVFFSDPQWTNYPSRFYRLRSP